MVPFPHAYKFTGKERDTESGLDLFGARYYGSSLGRFITPDWAAKPTAVPYAHFGNPQSLNLYSYALNNPTTLGDPDGHCDTTCQILKGIAIGTGKFLWNSSIPGMAVNGTRQGIQDLKAGPAAFQAKQQAQLKSAGVVAAAEAAARKPRLFWLRHKPIQLRWTATTRRPPVR
jgi:RHS repeat-associated protein